MKKIKVLLTFTCIAIMLSCTTKISAASGFVKLYNSYAFYELDNRPYVTYLSMDCVYEMRDINDLRKTKYDSASTKGVYLTNRIDSDIHYSSWYGKMTWYVNDEYNGQHSVYY